MTALEVRCLHQPADLLGLREQINALNLASEHPDPFSTCEFFCNFMERALGLPRREVQLWFLAVFSGSELIGYLALRRVARNVLGFASCGLEFLVGHEVDRPHLVARAAHAAAVSRAVFGYLLTQRAAWSWLELQGQTRESPLDPEQLGLHLPDCMTRDFPNWENCTIHLRWQTVQQYVQALSKNMRSEVRRRLRRLLGLGTLTLLTSSDPQAMPALFDLYCSVEQRSWKSNTEVAIGGAVRAEYIRGLLTGDQPLRMVMQILLLDGVPIAGLISGLFDAPSSRTLYALHLAYDSRLAAASPGSAVLLMGVRYGIEQGCSSINLLAGFTYYKVRWLAQTTPRRSIQIYRHGTALAWRRRLGDVLRRVRRGSQVRVAANPLRHAQSDAAADQPIGSIVTEARHFTAMLAQAHLGVCETLAAAEIAASAGIVAAPRPVIARQREPARSAPARRVGT